MKGSFVFVDLYLLISECYLAFCHYKDIPGISFTFPALGLTSHGFHNNKNKFGQ